LLKLSINGYLLADFTEDANFINLVQRPSDLINRKKPFAAWFPYTTIERLWCQLEELSNLGHMVDHYGKLKSILHGALQNHLNQVTTISFFLSSPFSIFL
jgi:hypothetical protein